MAYLNKWYSDIPNHWKVVSFNHAIERMGTGLNPRDNFVLSKNDDLYYVTIRNFKDNQLFLDDNCDRISKQAWETIQARSDLHKGDILFASISKDGQAYLLDSEPYNWNINESVFCIRVKDNLFDKRYFRYEITNVGYYADLLLDATGTTFKSIKQNKLRQSKLIAPPLYEQQAIADFLDDRCSKIDEIIAEATESIEEYKQLKQAVIFEAVTKGLDKNVPMKDSGVEWIGTIPQSWSLVRIPRVLDPNDPYPLGDGDHGLIKTDDYQSDGIPYIRVQNLGWGTDLSLDNVVYISRENNEKIKSSQLKPNDVLFCKTGGTIGKTGMVPLNLQVSNTTSHVGKITVNPKYNARYVFYVLSSNVGYRQFWEIACQKTTRPELSIAETRQIRLTWPPSREEQDKIVCYLDNIIPEYEYLILKKQALINDLQAYKKSLIYEVVTGKRKVV